MRVVFCVSSAFAVRHTINELLRHYEDAGEEVHVVGPPPGEDDAAQPGSARVSFHPVKVAREISPWEDLVTLVAVTAVLRRISPDLVDVSTPKMALLGGLAAWLARVPRRVYTIRGLRYETTTGVKRKLLIFCEWLACRSVHFRIAVSRSVRDVLVRDRIVAAHSIQVLGERASEGITLAHYRASPEMVHWAERFRRSKGWDRDCLVLGFVGRLTGDKGISELLESFGAISRKYPSVKLLMVGPVDPDAKLAVHLEEMLRRGSDVVHTGYVADDRVYFHAIDILVFPTYREGLPKVPMQASAAGKPIVSTRVTGVVDAVEDGVTGILVPPRNALALQQAIERLIANPDLRETLGRNGVEFVTRHFCAERMARRYRELVETR